LRGISAPCYLYFNAHLHYPFYFYRLSNNIFLLKPNNIGGGKFSLFYCNLFCGWVVSGKLQENLRKTLENFGKLWKFQNNSKKFKTIPKKTWKLLGSYLEVTWKLLGSHFHRVDIIGVFVQTPCVTTL